MTREKNNNKVNTCTSCSLQFPAKFYCFPRKQSTGSRAFRHSNSSSSNLIITFCLLRHLLSLYGRLFLGPARTVYNLARGVGLQSFQPDTKTTCQPAHTLTTQQSAPIDWWRDLCAFSQRPEALWRRRNNEGRETSCFYRSRLSPQTAANGQQIYGRVTRRARAQIHLALIKTGRALGKHPLGTAARARRDRATPTVQWSVQKWRVIIAIMLRACPAPSIAHLPFGHCTSSNSNSNDNNNSIH